MLSKQEYESEMKRLQGEPVKQQDWLKDKGLSVVMVCEERDAGSKGGVIKRHHRMFQPEDKLRRGTAQAFRKGKDPDVHPVLPRQYSSAGVVVIFDRSGYNRASIEHAPWLIVRPDDKKRARIN